MITKWWKNIQDQYSTKLAYFALAVFPILMLVVPDVIQGTILIVYVAVVASLYLMPENWLARMARKIGRGIAGLFKG